MASGVMFVSPQNRSRSTPRLSTSTIEEKRGDDDASRLVAQPRKLHHEIIGHRLEIARLRGALRATLSLGQAVKAERMLFPVGRVRLLPRSRRRDDELIEIGDADASGA